MIDGYTVPLGQLSTVTVLLSLLMCVLRGGFPLDKNCKNKINVIIFSAIEQKGPSKENLEA